MKRLWAKNTTPTELQKMGYLPPAEDPETIAWRKVNMVHGVARGRADGTPGGPYVIDTLFPATLSGQIDSSCIDEGTAEALYGLVRLLQPRTVLETGTHKGRSTRAIAKALKDNAEWQAVPLSYTVFMPPGHLYTVDLHDYGLMTSGALLPGTEVYVTQVVARTPEAFTHTPLDTLDQIDFAFLDGDHSPEGLEAELIFLDHHRAKECWVAVDNSRDPGWPGVARVLQDSRWPRISLASCTGLDLLWMS